MLGETPTRKLLALIVDDECEDDVYTEVMLRVRG